MKPSVRRLALLGASGHGKVVADAALLAGWDEVVFFDDAWPQTNLNGHWPVAGNTDSLLTGFSQFGGVLVSIGNCAVRWEKHQLLSKAGAPLVTVVHPHACVSQFSKLGKGSAVMAGAVVNADSFIGLASIINTGATVDHDCKLAHAVHISPGAHLSGNVKVGSCSWVGVGAAVRQGSDIGAGVMIGAGAVVVSNIADGLTVVGNPARPIKQVAL